MPFELFLLTVAGVIFFLGLVSGLVLAHALQSYRAATERGGDLDLTGWRP